MSEPRFGAETVFRELIAPVQMRKRELMKMVIPGLTDEQYYWIMVSIVSQVVHFTMHWRNIGPQSTISSQDVCAIPGSSVLSLSVEEYMEKAIEHVTRFSAGGIMAICREDGIEI